MDIKFKKALKSLNQSCWVLLIIFILVAAAMMLQAKGFLDVISSTWTTIITIVAFVLAIKFLKQEKYELGALTARWVAIWQIVSGIIAIATLIVSSFFVNSEKLGMGQGEVLATLTPTIIFWLILLSIPLILLCQSNKVLKLINETSPKRLKGLALLFLVVLIIAQLIPTILTIVEGRKSMQMLEDASDELGDISSSLTDSIINGMDGKTLMGYEVKSSITLYSDSTTLSVKVIADKNTQYSLGKSDVEIAEDVLKTLTEEKEGGVLVEKEGEAKSTLSEVESSIGQYDKYYSYKMIDEDTNKAIGILFVKAGIFEEEKVEDEQKETEEESKEDNKQEVNKNETATSDPYKNYKDVKWSGKKATFSHPKVGAVQEASIEGGFLKIKETYNSQIYYKEIDISGYDIKSICYNPDFQSAGTTIYLLANNGSVKYMRMSYLFEGEQYDEYLFKIYDKDSLKGKKIIEMTDTTNGLYNSKIYFLTADGKLITEDLHSYENLNNDFIEKMGRFMVINIARDNKIYLMDLKNETSNPINDVNGTNIIAKTIIYNYNSGDEQYMVITSKDELYFISSETEVAEKLSDKKVKDYEVEPNDYLCDVTFVMEDQTTITYDGVNQLYYNSSTQKVEEFFED